LEKDGNKKIKHLVAEMHDASIYPWDGDNYTNFISALCKMFSIAPRAFDEAGNYDHLARIVDLNPKKFKSSDFQIYFGSKEIKQQIHVKTDFLI
jgi:hypothetical protein